MCLDGSRGTSQHPPSAWRAAVPIRWLRLGTTAKGGVSVLLVGSLHAENVLTFGTFTLRFDGTSLVVVGPNSSEKSNILRIVDLVQKAADSVSG